MQVSPTVEGWKQEGAVEQSRRHVLRVLNGRFGTPPSDLASKIQNTTDMATLEHWLDAAVMAVSLAAFRAATGL